MTLSSRLVVFPDTLPVVLGLRCLPQFISHHRFAPSFTAPRLIGSPLSLPSLAAGARHVRRRPLWLRGDGIFQRRRYKAVRDVARLRFFLPFPFPLPSLVLLLSLSLTHRVPLSLLPTGGRRQTASSSRLEVLRRRSPPPPRPRRRCPSSSDPVPPGLSAPPPPRQVGLLELPPSAACSIPCLDHVCARALGLQGPTALRGVHVRGHEEAGVSEQAVERVDGAMLEVLGADLLHPPRANARLLADEHIQGGRRCRR
ncbi:hypothetical protein ACQJBY_071781 [Aegilops geniculata]